MTKKTFREKDQVQTDLFLCDVQDAVLKDILPQMEHSFYSLSKKPEMKVRRYEHKGNWLEVKPGIDGLATIYDKDILIYAISQVMAKQNAGVEANKTIKINAHALLLFANRGTSGSSYKRLSAAIDRLAGTQICTNISTKEGEVYTNFGLIEQGGVVREHGLDGRLKYVEITLSKCVYDAIGRKEVLTLNKGYFHLNPTERRIYELARKHCGNQPFWKISLELLHKKSGSLSTPKKFRERFFEIERADGLPDYSLSFNETDGSVFFMKREKAGHAGKKVFSMPTNKRPRCTAAGKPRKR